MLIYFMFRFFKNIETSCLHPNETESRSDLIMDKKNKKVRPKTNENSLIKPKTIKDLNDSNTDADNSNLVDGFCDLFNN